LLLFGCYFALNSKGSGRITKYLAVDAQKYPPLPGGVMATISYLKRDF